MTKEPRSEEPDGERARLSKRAVTDAALKLADADGLDALTIRKLAQHLGVTPMALYWHFRSKEDLLEGMAEQVWGEIDVNIDPAVPWWAQLQGLLESLVSLLRAHPAAAQLLRFFRSQHLPVVHTHTGLALPDGRDVAAWSWRAQLTGRASSVPCLLPPGDPDRAAWPELAAVEGELVLLKQTLSPFNGTALDQYLRNMGVQNLILAGVLTNGAVETAARNAGDRGFNAILVADACAALSPEDQQAGTVFASWYIVRSAREITDELTPLLA